MTELVKNPSIDVSGNWLQPSYAFADDSNYAWADYDGLFNIYGGYGFDLGSATIDKVEVGWIAWTSGNDKIIFEISWDGGSNWASSGAQTLGTSEPGSPTYYDFTSATSWTASKLSNTNLRTKVTMFVQGGADVVYLDWLPVRVNYTSNATTYEIYPVSDARFRTAKSIAKTSDAKFYGTQQKTCSSDAKFQDPPGQGWLSGWNYRKSHNILGSADGNLTNYQVKITVLYNTTADEDWEVNLEQGCKTDFGDVRFTTTDGQTLMDYYKNPTHTINGDFAEFWVEIPSIPQSSSITIYVYYGNETASTTSNGTNTFIFFDDFESGNFDKWQIRHYSGSYGWNISNTTVKEGNYSARVVGDGVAWWWLVEDVYPGGSSTCKYKVNCWWRTNTTASNGFTPGYAVESDDDWIYYVICSDNNDLEYMDYALYEWASNNYYATNTWYELTIGVDKPNNTVKAWNNGWYMGSIELTDWEGSAVVDIEQIGAVMTNKTYTGYLDLFWVANYTQNEPTHGTWGEEEEHVIFLPSDAKFVVGVATHEVYTTADAKFIFVNFTDVESDARFKDTYEFEKTAARRVKRTESIATNSNTKIGTFYEGGIDGVRIYVDALTQGEIDAIYYTCVNKESFYPLSDALFIPPTFETYIESSARFVYTDTVEAQSDARFKDTYSVAIYSDAEFRYKLVEFQVYTDARFRSTEEIETQSDALFLIINEFDIYSDAKYIRIETAYIYSNTKFKWIQETGIYSDASFLRIEETALNSNARFMDTYIFAPISDARFKDTYEDFIVSDAVFTTTEGTQIASDAVFLAFGVFTKPSDARFFKTDSTVLVSDTVFLTTEGVEIYSDVRVLRTEEYLIYSDVKCIRVGTEVSIPPTNIIGEAIIASTLLGETIRKDEIVGIKRSKTVDILGDVQIEYIIGRKRTAPIDIIGRVS